MLQSLQTCLRPNSLGEEMLEQMPITKAEEMLNLIIQQRKAEIKNKKIPPTMLDSLRYAASVHEQTMNYNVMIDPKDNSRVVLVNRY
jgi:hypothetical protein